MGYRQLHLNVNLYNAGTYASAWRASSQPASAFLEVDHYVQAAKVAERGLLDAVFLADVPALADQPTLRPYNALEPTIILATIAAQTSHIGLIGTLSTSYNDPYNLARRLSSLDVASKGRAGWNVVTTAADSASRNFGFDAAHAHGERYRRAHEFVEVVKKLWSSWDDDAFIGDRASGRYIDMNKVRAIDHQGEHFNVRGPLNVQRSPQGHPVIVQAGGSTDGQRLAAEHAEVIFCVAHSPAEGQKLRCALNGQARALGRKDDIIVLPGLGTVIASTEAEARRQSEALLDLIPLEYGLGRLCGVLQVQPHELDLDAPLPELPLPVDGSQTFFQATLNIAREHKLTVRQLIRRLAGNAGHRFLIGTPEQIAADIEHWFVSGAADGFNVAPHALPDGLEVFVDEVVPLLQARGLFRKQYSGSTLRSHLGLEHPAGPGAQVMNAG